MGDLLGCKRKHRHINCFMGFFDLCDDRFLTTAIWGKIDLCLSVRQRRDTNQEKYLNGDKIQILLFIELNI